MKKLGGLPRKLGRMSQAEGKSRAYWMGARAAMDGDAERNPYPLHSQERRDWYEGYNNFQAKVNALAAEFFANMAEDLEKVAK